MSFRLRAARVSDLEPLYQMAKLTGGGFTNLPPDRKALGAKLDRAAKAFAREGGELTDEVFVLVLENCETGEVRGTCQIFTQVGQSWPFYSYRLTTLTQHSEELQRTVRAEMLKNVPLARFGTTEEVANVVLFLCSPLASYVTGQTIEINGGWRG